MLNYDVLVTTNQKPRRNIVYVLAIASIFFVAMSIAIVHINLKFNALETKVLELQGILEDAKNIGKRVEELFENDNVVDKDLLDLAEKAANEIYFDYVVKNEPEANSNIDFLLGDAVGPSESEAVEDKLRWKRGVMYSEEEIYEDDDDRIRAKRREEIPVRKHYGKKAPISAVHFNGYTPNDSPHVKQGHMRHVNYTYLHWKEPNWVKRHYGNLFRMKDGVLEATESGLYFIYAQIHFLTTHDIAGFQILKNNHNLMSCMVTSLTHNNQKPEKSNTCYTAGAEYLEVGDRISVRDMNDYAYSKFETGKSFFGAIKLN